MSSAPVANDRIPHRSLLVLLPAMILEVGVLRLSGELIAQVGPWAWLSAVVIGSVAGLNIWIIYGLVRRHGFPEFPELLQSLLGPWGARGLLFVIGLAVLTRAARIVRISTELITQELLISTPLWAVLIFSLPVVVYISWHGFEPVARYVAITFPFYYGFIVLVLVLVLLRADLEPFIILADWSGQGFIRSLVIGIPEVQGYGMLFIVLPWVWRRDRAAQSVFGGWVVAFVLFMLLLISTIGALGVSAATVTWPTLDLADLISVPGLFIERMESVFFMVWLFLLSTALLLTVFGCSYVLSAAVTRKASNYRVFVPIVVTLVVIAALLPPTLTWVDIITRELRLLGWLEIVLPPSLWLVSLVRRRVRRA